jgi:hypothetical protein
MPVARSAGISGHLTRPRTIPIGSNTTLIGLPGSEITGANLRVDAQLLHPAALDRTRADHRRVQGHRTDREPEPGRRVDIVAAYNTAFDPDLADVPAFTPLLRRTVHPAVAVPWVVSALAGPRSLGDAR